MPANTLVYNGRGVEFPRAITAPEFSRRTILDHDAFQFVELWLRRGKQDEALFYWTQARSFFEASRVLDATASPLTSYYCMLNATKTLLKVKGITTNESHGVSGEAVSSRVRLANEESSIKRSGVLAGLSQYLKEPESNSTHSLDDILSNLPFIHRAYALTRNKTAELFVRIHAPTYVRHPTENRVWFSAEVRGHEADRRVLRWMPRHFEIDEGHSDRTVIRMKKRVKWFPRQGADSPTKDAAIARLRTHHQKLRLDIVSISANQRLWYIKRRLSTFNILHRYGLTLMLMAMHRLSELARYDPKGLSRHLSGKENWLLNEFVSLAPSQFIDEISSEITGLDFRIPGVRR